MGLANRALKGSPVVSWAIGLDASQPHLRTAYNAQRPVDSCRMGGYCLMLRHPQALCRKLYAGCPATMRGESVHRARPLDRLEPIFVYNAPCESGQKRSLFKLGHCDFRNRPLPVVGSRSFQPLPGLTSQPIFVVTDAMFPSALANSRVREPSGGRTPGSAPAPARSSAMGVRRGKAALSSGCKSHPANRSSRKQSGQSWR